MKFTTEEMLAKLPLPVNDKWKEGVRDLEPFRTGKATLVFFAPRGTDYQTEHEEDEFYFITCGRGDILIDGQRFSFVAGDAFFVPALSPHRFENFSEDFTTWAIFLKK